ncbi:MAG: hypothetical protein HC892_11080 [Saprospiraceae bacterium]|nr:hypothetical protein [Saprospiraceae bacterium]
MREKKTHTLLKAIQELPNYVPPSAVWEQIEVQLEETALHKAIAQLPVHQPPSTVWRQIEKRLSPLHSINKKAAIAASLVLMASAGIWYLSKQDTNNITKVYTTEPGKTIDFESDWLDDELAFERAKQKFAQYVFLEEQVEYKVLVEELEELETAKASVEAAFKRYGKQPHLVVRMKNISLRQSEVLKKMVAFI